MDNTKDDLARKVLAAIKRHGFLRLSAVRCEAKGSTVYLRGKLSNVYLKQVAKSIASKVPGVEQVVDRIEVFRQRSPTG